jgi:UDP-glucose 6-dehydrogenase
LCVKKSSSNLEELNRGRSPYNEPGLSEMLQKKLDEERIKFSTDMKEAVDFSEVIFICVGTPQVKLEKLIFLKWKKFPDKLPSTWILTNF